MKLLSNLLVLPGDCVLKAYQAYYFPVAPMPMRPESELSNWDDGVIMVSVCAKEWKYNHALRTFYLLIISQGAVDIFVMVTYFIFWTLRIFGAFSEIFWEYQDHYVASWCFTQTYISVIIRCFGILLISLQRYLSVCKNGKRIEQFVNISHRWTLPILHWVIPILYSIPLFAVRNVTFLSKENLEVIADKHDITLATSMTLGFVSTTFLSSSFCYGALLRFLVINRYSSNVSVKREFRLYVQMLGLFFAFVLLVIYNIMQFTFSLHSNDGPVFTMRIVFPIISCFLSYVNAWLMLFLNADIRRKILRLLGRESNSSVQVTVVISQTRKPSSLAEMQRAYSLCSFERRNERK
ncbi:hypothetical protein Y032_0630g855 [Ancylostoma ceylanicum]|uniref:G-protein coupled receptors family 1 profile domain-containing protein n=1 Tax=Ancylostoma ceylanicum TaxID=53326 RepID=A0A016WM63_9BILA|nr:hypothetical protein Y032_0630g855 [Ancylostoma ceylanicum]